MSSIERKEREREERQHEILKAARSVFLKHGFEQTSMDMVAEKSQLAKGTLYLYFKSKEELYISLVESDIEQLNSNVAEVLTDKIDAETKLLNATKVYYEFARDNGQYFKILMALSAGLFTEKVDTERLHRIKNRRFEIMDVIEQAFRQGVADGDFIASLNTRDAVLAFWASAWGATMLATDVCKVGTEREKRFTDLEPETFVLGITAGLLKSYRAKEPHASHTAHKAHKTKPVKLRRAKAM